MEWDKIYRDLSRRNWIILLILSLLSWFLMSRLITSGVILGGLIIIFNFDLLQHTIRRAFSSDGVFKTRKLFFIAKTYLRLTALGAIIYLLLKRGWVDPIGLAIGLSTVGFGIVSFGIKRAFKTFKGETL